MCEDVEAIADEIAAGERVLGDAEAAHVAACPRCAASIAMARAMDAALSAPVPPTPASLSANVLRAVRRERWRSELLVDRAFNLALLAGSALIVLAAWLMIRAGSISVFLADRLARFGTLTVPQPGPNAWAYVLSVLLLVSAATTWWWVEGES